jgi:hypothetical protein
VKLDELIRATAEARDALIGAERLDEEELHELSEEERSEGGGDVWPSRRPGTIGTHEHGAPDPPGSTPGKERAGRTV